MHGVTAGPGSLAAGFLPDGARLDSGTAVVPSEFLTYRLPGGSDPPRIELSFGLAPDPPISDPGGRGTVQPVTIQGHPGRLTGGQPDPDWIGVYWSDGRYLLDVVGYQVPASVVLQVAQHTVFSPPETVALPESPGPIVASSRTVRAARQSLVSPQGQPGLPGGPRSTTVAKLSSWTEVEALMVSDWDRLHSGNPGNTAADIYAVPPTAAAAPWRPLWAVLVAPTAPVPGAPGTPAPSRGQAPSLGQAPSAVQARSPGQPELVMVDAATGQVVLKERTDSDPTWFAALTDRDPAQAGCPGGSRARLPFGVLTRDEQTYTQVGVHPPGADPADTTTVVKLTTVAALNRADPGLYGGCVHQDCSLDQLVWPAVEIVRAPPGHTVTCAPLSVPPGYQPRQVSTYFTISVPGNSETGCGPLPAWFTSLTDLAPPGGTK